LKKSSFSPCSFKAPTGENSTQKEDKQNTPCFGIDYFEKYGKKAFEVPKELRTYLWVKEKLVLSKKRHEYSTKLAQMLNARSVIKHTIFF
jgi:hypothetical protein